MRNWRRFIRNSIRDGIQKVNTIYKAESQYVTQNPSNSIQKQVKTLKFTKMQYPELDKYFVRFFNSKPVEGKVTGKSLAFVVGAQNVGKSQYIEKNLAQVSRRKKQLSSEFNSFSLTKQKKYPQFNVLKTQEYLESQIKQIVFDNSYSLIVKKNYKESGELNFTNFIEDLHDQIFDQIHALLINFQLSQRNKQKLQNSQLSKNQNQKKQQQPMTLLTPQIIKRIVTHEFAPEYLFIYIKDVIYAIIQDKDLIYLDKQSKEIVQLWNEEHIANSSSTVEHFFDKLYPELIQILWNATKNKHIHSKTSLQLQKTQIALKLFYSVFKRIQYQNRTEQHVNSWYQSGIQTTNYLFDILNFLSGTGKYLRALQKQYTAAQTNQQRQQVKSYLQSSNNYILKGNHIDTMLCLMNLQELSCFNNKSKQFLDFFDHTICRTLSQTGFRTHFPIIIEIPNRAFLDQILQLGKIQGSNPVIIQIPGYAKTFLRHSNLMQILEVKKIEQMFWKLGRNPHTWKKAIQNMAKGVNFNDIEDGKAPYQHKQKIIAQAKLNRVYTFQQCLPLLNSQTLDFELINLLKILNKINGMGTTTFRFFAPILFKQSYFQAFLGQNILYHMYYYTYFDYSSNLPSYLNLYKNQSLNRLWRNNSWLKYRIWKHFSKEYSIMSGQLKYKQKTQQIYFQRGIFMKEHPDMQLWSTYYGPLTQYPIDYYHRQFKPTLSSE